MATRKKPAESGTYNYLGFGIKDEDLDDELYARPSVNIIQTDADDTSNIETADDEGHTGTSTMKVATFRQSANASPTWTQLLRFSAGLEEVIYCALPNHSVEPVIVPPRSNIPETKYYKHTFDLTPIRFDEEGNEEATDVPLATIYMSFAKGMNDTRVCNNAALNELSFESPADDSPTLSPTFESDYPNFDTINILRMFRTLIRSRTASPNSVRVLIGKIDASSIEEMTEIECYQNASFDLNNNMEDIPCHNDVFGTVIKTLGERELTGSIEFPRTEITRYLQSEYEAFERCKKINDGEFVKAHIVSEEIIQRQIWYLVEFGDIPYLDYTDLDDDGNPKMYYTGVKRRCLFKFPIVEFRGMSHPRSGADAMNITAEWTSVASEGNSIMQCEILSELPDIRIDDEGVSLTELIDEDHDEELCGVEPMTHTVTLGISDAEGNPYSNVKVEWGEKEVGKTNSNGLIEIINVADGEYRMVLTPPEDSGYLPRDELVTVPFDDGSYYGPFNID